MPERPAFSVAAIRAAALAQGKKASERSVAAEIGMSYTAYRSFVRGAKPHAETRAKLVAWYLRISSGHPQLTPKEDLEAAVSLLTRHVRGAATPKLARNRVLDLVNALLGELGTDNEQEIVPELIEALLSRTSIRKPAGRS